MAISQGLREEILEAIGGPTGLGRVMFERLVQAARDQNIAGVSSPGVINFEGIRGFAAWFGYCGLIAQDGLLEALRAGVGFSSQGGGVTIGGLWTYALTQERLIVVVARALYA